MEKLPFLLRPLMLGLMAVSLAGCNGYSTARERAPKVKPVGLGSALLQRAIKTPAKTPEEQIGRYLNAASYSADQLAKNPADEQARNDYNFAVARIFEVIHDNQLKPWLNPLVCPGATEDWTLVLKTDGKYDPGMFRVLPADRFEFKGKLVKERTVKKGIGAPMITANQGFDFTKVDPFVMGKTSYYGVTVLINFKGHDCTMVYYDPLSVEDVQFAGHTVPLAADFTAPIAFALAELKPRKTELQRMFKPDKFAGTSRLARLQPWDSKKIPILCIHGLGDSQATWAPMLEILRGDPVIRENYQFWFFSYPTGYPYPIMAENLRQQLDKMHKTYPDRKKFVVIGHSMGGMIARELITDSGMKIWDAYFDVPPAKLPVSDSGRKLITGTLIFNHRPEVSRVIFSSASLGGADMAESFFGRLGRKIIGTISTAFGDKEDTETAVGLAKPSEDGNPLAKMPTAIDALVPGNRFLKAINSIPPTKGIPYHSIIGDRGKGGNKDHTKPVSTDGVVPYWSSHIDGAQSEIIVPSGHWSNQHPAAIEEIRRILYLHIGKQPPVTPLTAASMQKAE
ncbi:triacylglycerol esterase/lipase EstA (alpha/beta hydrolase family) [Roseimicrobium gellanilyticum]|uniref:Triacylglycerol esterase/lipase EstA (Alpha/beta hydrolase family) n=1 Tax=Roseimicrobium gellanilyticum TaxID=748857 RepID=A0A366HHG9_9BACT|nr:alpha/beta hydrolase [Roseimicrobium gellanilyticum]RBP41275.1 triacylglycerol esterase/lipase EstA (alpha/beta hydrolase family) [Roseimicrobium gellanilyticum]